MLSTDAFLYWHEMARGLAYAMLAALLIYAVVQYVGAHTQQTSRRWVHTRSLRSSLIIGLLLVGVIPALTLNLILTERSAELRQERMADRLEETAMAVAHAIDRFIDKQVSGIASAASTINSAGAFDSETLAQSLLLYHGVYEEFLTMLAADSDGMIVAASSRLGGKATRLSQIEGMSVADREYFIAPMRDGKTFVSSVFRGRGFGRDPIAAVSAVLRGPSGERVGIVEGSLNLRSFHKIDQERSHIDGAVMVLVDRDNRVIYASPEAAMTELDSIAMDPMILGEAESADGLSFTFVATEAGEGRSYFAAAGDTDFGWRVFIRAPADPIARQMFQDYSVGAVLLLLACTMSLLLAGAMVKRVSRSVRDMHQVVRSLNPDSDGQKVSIPRNTPREFRPVFKQMRKRAAHLNHVYGRLQKSIDAGEKLRKELTQSIARKEVEIAERTADLEEANRKLTGMSKKDPLTGIPNRREFDTFINRVWRIGARESTPVAVVVADVDFFKIYNDTLGHQAGDVCLQKVASALSGCATRPLDIVARFGGEEFIAVLGGATVADALVVGERMRKAIVDLQIAHPGSSHEIVSISVGAASVFPGSGDDPEDLVKAADDALYYAKAAGRNCVVFSKDGEYVTYNPVDHDLDSTNVIKLLAGDGTTRR